jgi:hypothetical protein
LRDSGVVRTFSLPTIDSNSRNKGSFSISVPPW